MLNGRGRQHPLGVHDRLNLYFREDQVTSDAFRSQISSAYSRTVRSLENLTEQATLTIALPAQAS
jgi:hypothetical protein